MRNIKISAMTGKLAGFKAINFSSLSNIFCEEMSKITGTVCSFCYSRKALKEFRQRCERPWDENARIMSNYIDIQELPRFNIGERVRFLAHGEFQNEMQVKNFVRIAEVNPKTTFAIWTKRVAMFDGLDIPENLIIVQSSVTVNMEAYIDVNADKVFTVYSSLEDIPEDTFVCQGRKCGECGYCYSKETGDKIGEVIRK